MHSHEFPEEVRVDVPGNVQRVQISRIIMACRMASPRAGGPGGNAVVFVITGACRQITAKRDEDKGEETHLIRTPKLAGAERGLARATCPSRAATCRTEWVRFTDKIKPWHKIGVSPHSVRPVAQRDGLVARATHPNFGIRIQFGAACCVCRMSCASQR